MYHRISQTTIGTHLNNEYSGPYIFCLFLDESKRARTLELWHGPQKLENMEVFFKKRESVEREVTGHFLVKAPVHC